MSEGVVMKIVGTDDFATAFDGQYLVEYDPARRGVDPDGHEMIAHVVTTPDIKSALVFQSIFEAWELWKKENGMRSDGKPNRPLTAFSITFEPAPAE